MTRFVRFAWCQMFCSYEDGACRPTIELHATSGAVPQATTILTQSCDPATLPAGLYSGFFDMDYVGSINGIGCAASLPRGFRECHTTLNKDSSATPKGKLEFGRGPLNHHVMALSLAIGATESAWRALKDRIEARWGSDTVDGKCVFAKLAWGGDRSCLRKWDAVGEISTRQEYEIPDGRLIHELEMDRLNLNFEIDDSVEYPGPQAPPVYADVRGTTRQRGTFCQWAVTSRGTTPKQCQPFTEDTIGSDDGRVKVTPNSEPIELDWRVTFPGKKPECKGPLIVRLDPGRPARQPFLECPGGMPGPLKPIRLTYSGTFNVSPQ